MNRLSHVLRYISANRETMNSAALEHDRAKRRSRSKRIYATEKGRTADQLFSRLRWHLIRAKGNNRTEFGCSVFELREHMEKLFRGNMDWSNYGKIWEVDHVCPRSLYSANEMLGCFHYSNLRPRFIWRNRIDSRMKQRCGFR